MGESTYSVANKPKILRVMKTTFVILVLGFAFLIIINSCKSDGIRSFYCLSKDNCITVWKPGNGDVYIIYGTYSSTKKPTDDYVKVLNNRYDNIHLILLKDDKLLIDVDENATVINQSTNGLMELYKDNKASNDSLYTYFDGKYNRYKKEVYYISVNIKDNYATDKSGKKLK